MTDPDDDRGRSPARRSTSPRRARRPMTPGPTGRDRLEVWSLTWPEIRARRRSRRPGRARHARPLATATSSSVTSKVVSKAEGRGVARDRADAVAERDRARRRPPRRDGDRARRATGWCWPPPASTPPTCRRATRCRCPSTPMRTARRIRDASAERTGVNVARGGHRHRGPGLAQRPDRPGDRVRRHRPRSIDLVRRDATARQHLVVTAPAIADEVAAAADLVKGKTRRPPVAVSAGSADLVLARRATTDPGGRSCSSAPQTRTCSALGAREAAVAAAVARPTRWR